MMQLLSHLALIVLPLAEARSIHRLGAPLGSLVVEEDEGDSQRACIDIPTPDTCSGVPHGDCKPFRSPDACPLRNSFQLLIQRRALTYKNYPSQVEEENYWFHHLEDKTAQYMFSAREGFRAPRVYFCTSDGPNGLDDFVPPLTTNSFVVRATNLHSSQGVYVLPDGYDGVELLRDEQSMSLEDLKEDLQALGATDIIVEEYIPGYGDSPLPTEYKFHVFNGEIGSINVVMNRGSECACWAEVDEEWNRQDENGCFTPSDSTESAGTCETAVEFALGKEHAYPMKGFNLCSEVPQPDACILNDLITVAKAASRKLGVYARIDIFVSATKEIVIQEYTMNHMSGLRHCSSKTDENGCVDPCFLGAMWEQASGNPLFGGPLTDVPAGVAEWNADLDKCLLAMETDINPTLVSKCTVLEIQESPRFISDSPVTPLPTTSMPSSPPTILPSAFPSDLPSAYPSRDPSSLPSMAPSATPSATPSLSPSVSPSSAPSGTPSESPSVTPSNLPTDKPSVTPSVAPSRDPSSSPSNMPSVVRSEMPSPSPSGRPTKVASYFPSSIPSSLPSLLPSLSPSTEPSFSPSTSPSQSPSWQSN